MFPATVPEAAVGFDITCGAEAGSALQVDRSCRIIGTGKTLFQVEIFTFRGSTLVTEKPTPLFFQIDKVSQYYNFSMNAVEGYLSILTV